MTDSETAEVPFRPISEHSINEWFDYWMRHTQPSRQHTVECIRKLAIAGTRKARRNKAALRAAVSSELRKLADAWDDSMEGE